MRTQGRFFTDYELDRIAKLLATTDMSISEIAQRMNCSRAAIGSINRKLNIRDYAGCRSSWQPVLVPAFAQAGSEE
jgi:DNA-binding MurR/RpiR family transcriptional regulator